MKEGRKKGGMRTEGKKKNKPTHQERSAPPGARARSTWKWIGLDYKGRAVWSPSCVRCLFWYLLAYSACEHQFHTIPVLRSLFKFIAFSNRWLAYVKNREQGMIPQYVQRMYGDMEHGARTNAAWWCFKVRMSLSVSWALVKNVLLNSSHSLKMETHRAALIRHYLDHLAAW